jgi:hypothetical protein
MLSEIRSVMRAADLGVAVRPSSLTAFAHFLPTADELKRYQ